MKTDPQPQHLWLKKLVGSWTYQSECQMGPDQPPALASGRETVRAIGDLWVVGDGAGEMPGGGGDCVMQITLGFNPNTGRYVGTWVGSMMDLLWIYDGEMDADGRILTLNSVGPSFSGDGTTANYQDIIELVDDNTRLLHSQVQQADGSWNRFMTGRYTRAA